MDKGKELDVYQEPYMRSDFESVDFPTDEDVELDEGRQEAAKAAVAKGPASNKVTPTPDEVKP